MGAYSKSDWFDSNDEFPTAITLCSCVQDTTKMQDNCMYNGGKSMMKDCLMMKDGQVMTMKRSGR